MLGNPTLANGGLNLNVTGNAAIVATGFSATSGSGSNFIVNNLNLGSQVLTITGSNAARLRVAGTTTLLGNISQILTNTAAPSGMLELDGQITDGGSVTVATSTAGSTAVTLASAPPSNFIVGTAFLGSTVATISGTSVTLASGASATLSSASAAFSDGFALTKAGGSATGVLIISNGATGAAANNFTGGVNIMTGALQVTATTGTPLGTGPVIVNPGGMLRLAGAGSIGSAYGGSSGISSLSVLSTVTALGAIGLDNSFDPSSALTNANGAAGFATMNSVWGGTVMLETPNFTTSLSEATIGNGKQFLGAGFTLSNVNYLGATLGAGSDNVYRLGANNAAATTLTFAGADGVLTGSNAVQIGSPISDVTIMNVSASATAPTTYGSGTVVIENSNPNLMGSITVNKASALIIQTGGAATASLAEPLGTGNTIEVFGTLTAQGPTGSFYNAGLATPTNADTVILRPGGVLRFDNSAGGNFTGSGGQGRWGRYGGYYFERRRGKSPRRD